MVHFNSAAALSLVVLALGVSGAPADNKHSNKVITYDDIKNAQPVVPTVTDPTKKALSGDAGDNSTLLQARPDLAAAVNDAKKSIPNLLANDKAPKPDSKTSRRDLEKRESETCEIFTNRNNPGIQATPAALALAAQRSCQLWFPGTGIYAVPEGSFRTATYFNQLKLEYHVRPTTCTPYRDPIKEYYATSQAICIAQFAKLFRLADTICAGDHTGVSGQNDKKVPIWYAWKTFA